MNEKGKKTLRISDYKDRKFPQTSLQVTKLVTYEARQSLTDQILK